MGAVSKQPPYLFKVSRDKIGLVHTAGATIRVNPRDERQLDGAGGLGMYAQFDAEVKGGLVRLKSIRTGKYIRIHPHRSDVKLDCGGTGGKWCWFRVYATDRITEGYVKLESAEMSGRWLAVKPDGSGLQIGRGGPFCLIRGIRLGAPPPTVVTAPPVMFVPAPPPPVATMGGYGPVPVMGVPGEHGTLAPVYPIPMRPVVVDGGGLPPEYGMVPPPETTIVAPAKLAPEKKKPAKEERFDYAWKVSRKMVVISHHASKTLRVNPKKLSDVDVNGGYGKFARFEVQIMDKGKKCKIKSNYTGKYLRIHGDKIDCEGGGGKWCVFKIHLDGLKVKLESVEKKGKYLAVKKDASDIKIGGGGRWCKMHAFRFD